MGEGSEVETGVVPVVVVEDDEVVVEVVPVGVTMGVA